MWYDAHRGAVLRADVSGGSMAILEWVSGTGWRIVRNLSGAPALISFGAYDIVRNRIYMGPSGTGRGVGFLADLAPASFEPHGLPCGTAVTCTLNLTHSWTRAWRGQVLSLDAGALPLSIAMLAMGFTDQAFAGSALPLDLSPFGMTGCTLNVAAEATALSVGTGGVANFQIPVPNVPGLVGSRFWVQAFAPVPGSNPAGVLTSASWVGTVGFAF